MQISVCHRKLWKVEFAPSDSENLQMSFRRKHTTTRKSFPYGYRIARVFREVAKLYKMRARSSSILIFTLIQLSSQECVDAHQR